MTYREPPPVIRCPVCRSDHDIEHHASGHLCRTCWTVFTGAVGEWDRMQSVRDQYEYQRAKNEEARGGA